MSPTNIGESNTPCTLSICLIPFRSRTWFGPSKRQIGRYYEYSLHDSVVASITSTTMQILSRFYDLLRFTNATVPSQNLRRTPIPHLDDYQASSERNAYYHDGFINRRMLASSPKSLYTSLQKQTIQTIATVTSCLTLVATLITFYWFCKMQKRLRHK